MRLYLDSNVFIAFVREEIDRAFNLRYLESERFFSFCETTRAELVISVHFLKEVKQVIGVEEAAVREFFREKNVLVLFAGMPASAAIDQVVQKTGIHYADAVHVACAVETGCDYIITFNVKDFRKANRIISCASPSTLSRIV